MKFTRSAPTEPGFYWIKLDVHLCEEISIAEIVEVDEGYFKVLIIGSDWKLPLKQASFIKWGDIIPEPERRTSYRNGR